MQFVNERSKTLTHRVLCLSGTAAAVVILKFVIFFLSERNVLEEFHEAKYAQKDKADWLEEPYGKILVVTGGLILALIVPCCGFLGAKTNNRPCICFFSCCNCCGGCLHILEVLLIILLMAGLGMVETHCRPTGTCQGIMDACKYHKSHSSRLSVSACFTCFCLRIQEWTEESHGKKWLFGTSGDLYDLKTYEGCLDYMVSYFPTAYAGLGVVLGLTCIAICFQCASARWGKELYDVLAFEDLCIDSDDDRDGVWVLESATSVQELYIYYVLKTFKDHDSLRSEKYAACMYSTAGFCFKVQQYSTNRSSRQLLLGEMCPSPCCQDIEPKTSLRIW